MKTVFVRPSAVKKFAKENSKRISKDAIEMIDRVVLRVLQRSLNTCKGFKTITDKEVSFVSSTLSSS